MKRVPRGSVFVLPPSLHRPQQWPWLGACLREFTAQAICRVYHERWEEKKHIVTHQCRLCLKYTGFFVCLFVFGGRQGGQDEDGKETERMNKLFHSKEREERKCALMKSTAADIPCNRFKVWILKNKVTLKVHSNIIFVAFCKKSEHWNQAVVRKGPPTNTGMITWAPSLLSFQGVPSPPSWCFTGYFHPSSSA